MNALEDNDITEEAIYHSRAQGSALDKVKSAVGMSIRIPKTTASGRNTYQLLTNEILLEEEREILLRSKRELRKRKPVSETLPKEKRKCVQKSLSFKSPEASKQKTSESKHITPKSSTHDTVRKHKVDKPSTQSKKQRTRRRNKF